MPQSDHDSPNELFRCLNALIDHVDIFEKNTDGEWPQYSLLFLHHTILEFFDDPMVQQLFSKMTNREGFAISKANPWPNLYETFRDGVLSKIGQRNF